MARQERSPGICAALVLDFITCSTASVNQYPRFSSVRLGVVQGQACLRRNLHFGAAARGLTFLQLALRMHAVLLGDPLVVGEEEWGRGVLGQLSIILPPSC